MRQFSILLLSVILFSCNGVLDKKYNQQTYHQDIKEIRDKDTTEANLIGAYVLKALFTKEDLSSKSYYDILEIAEQHEKQVQEKTKELESLMTLSVTEKKETRHYIFFTFNVKNQSDKKIVAYKGEIFIADMFGDVYWHSGYGSEKDTIPAKSEKLFYASVDYNDYDRRLNKVRETSLDKLKLTWKPSKIMFEDGSIVEVPQ